ncbi:MAG TPA: beta-L-arabinofuranosidase domain-containing protein [Fimbriimonas sp.]|nr:beta-L-arabinofuranosidase domain-containing protein [Fimbriimonas sp.]
MLIALVASLMISHTSIVDRPPVAGGNSFYFPSRRPLQPTPLVKLPITAFDPSGWLRKSLELQRDGLTGHLGEISVWLTKKNNAWLNKDGKGDYGWEEVPYWLRGYSRIAYVLRDPKMLDETKFWIEGTLGSQRENGDFGPIHNHSKGFRDLWAQMLMLQVLQSWYEYSGDERILPFMTRYFKWELMIPDDHFLKDYWENSRGGDNLASVYWLYNRTGDSFLLELATKIDRNTADWRQLGDLPNYHNVNIAECFREPGTYYLQSGKQEDLEATYRDFDFIREKYGQVPGGMFGSDENCRPGHDDPHQAVETCGMVEQLGSNDLLMQITGDPKWAANSEDVAFNTLPAAFTSDYRALRYLTAPNMAVSDAKNHSPGLDNGGPFLLMNPFSSRCCQHNSSSAWVNYLEGTWQATQDNGLAAIHFSGGTVTAKVGSGDQVTITTTTKYPFDESVKMVVKTHKPTDFPLYVLIPDWAKGATVEVPGDRIDAEPSKYVLVHRTWSDGDMISIHLPMHPSVHTWDQMKNSVSVNYGPLTFSLKIDEEFNRVDGLKTTQGDAGWQPGADPSKWPTYEILPKSPWNFGLVQKPSFKVIKRSWPTDDNPFTLHGAPLEIVTEGKEIPSWQLDQNELVAILPKSPVAVSTPMQSLTLIPMGAARLRISAFPTVR